MNIKTIKLFGGIFFVLVFGILSIYLLSMDTNTGNTKNNEDMVSTTTNKNYVAVDNISSIPPNTKPQFTIGEVITYEESAAKIASGKNFKNISGAERIFISRVVVTDIRRFAKRDCYNIESNSPLSGGGGSACVDKESGDILYGEIDVYAPWMLRLSEGIRWIENITYLNSGVVVKNEYAVESIEQVNGKKCFKVAMKRSSRAKNMANWNIDQITYLWVDVDERILVKMKFCTPEGLCPYEKNLKSIEK